MFALQVRDRPTGFAILSAKGVETFRLLQKQHTVPLSPLLFVKTPQSPTVQEIHVSAENLGEILMGDSIENSLYDVRTCAPVVVRPELFGLQQYCRFLSSLDLSGDCSAG